MTSVIERLIRHYLAKRDDATTAGERGCQDKLYELIRERACSGSRTGW